MTDGFGPPYWQDGDFESVNGYPRYPAAELARRHQWVADQTAAHELDAVVVGGATGMALAGRHVWLQSLPAEQVPDCGMGLNYMLETMPVLDVLREVLYGAGECAEVMWTFLGISIPGWALIWFTIFTLGTIGILVYSNRRKVSE